MEELKQQFIDPNAPLVAQKKMDTYEKVFALNTEFFSTYNPDIVELALIDYLRKEKEVEPSKISKDKYKIKFALCTKGQGGHE